LGIAKGPLKTGEMDKVAPFVREFILFT